MTRVDRSRLPEVGPDPAFALPTVVRHTLPNGLNLRTVEHASVPLLTIVVQVDGGSGADPADREGLAAITADMVDEGTGSMTALDVSEALARIGAEYDVDVGPDAITFTLTTLTRFAERGAALLGDMLVRPALREDDFDRVRKLRLDRLRQMKDVPPAVAERAFLRLLYGTHPYGHLAIGSDAALRAMSVAESAQFHAGTFLPGRATVIAAGAMSHDELRAVVAGAFGGWTAEANDQAVPVVAASIEPAATPPRLAIVAREGAAQSELRIGHLAARRNTPHYSALLVMNAILGGQFVSRVNLKLREEKGYTYGARTGFDWRRGLAPFSMQASVHTAATADSIRDTLSELEAIRGGRPATEQELTLAKASLTRGYPRNFETAQQVARAVAQLALYDLPDSYFAEFVPRTNAVTAEDVTLAASRYLDPSRVTTLVVGDHAAIDESLRSLELGEAQLLPPELVHVG
jgi:predicted Zn-dependent peptidase